MLDRFLQGQLDYVFLCYGLDFILLAAACATMGRDPTRRLPWVWLGLFGITHGISEWLDMAALTFPGGAAFVIARLVMAGISFLLLLEFGRRGLHRLRGHGPGRWIYLPLLAGALSGGLSGIAGLEATIRYALAFPGGLWAAATLFVASRDERPGRRPLLLAALALACYAIAAGVVVPGAPFPPASLLNLASFSSLTGLPVQLVRGVLAALLALAIWRYSYRHVRPLACPGARAAHLGRHSIWLAAIILAVLALGWVLTDSIGEREGGQVRDALLDQIRVAAAALDPGAAALFSAATQEAPPALARLREQLRELQRGEPHLRSLRLVAQRAGRPVTIAATGTDDPVARDPRALRAVFTTGRAVAAGPFTDVRGTFATGFVPVHDPTTGRLLAVLVAASDAGSWPEAVGALRLLPICLILLLVLLLVTSSVLRLRAWESAQLAAASQQHLLEMQHIARLGSWTHEVATGQVTCSEGVHRIFGQDPQGRGKSALDRSELFHPEDWPHFASAHRQATQEGTGYEVETRIFRPDGTIRHVIWRAHAQRAESGMVTRVLGAVQDITERKQVEERLRELSLVDELTGLSNRRALAVLATQQMRIADRSRQPLVLIFADMDRLKSINDAFGHTEGDRALRGAAEVLRATLRASDIIARIGGDEFVALAVETPEANATALLSRLQRNLQAFNANADRPYRVSLSFGLVRYDWENPCSFEELLAHGDAVMYQQKSRLRDGLPAAAG